MKAKTKFFKLYYKMPRNMRNQLMFYLDDKPFILNVMSLEIRKDTELGKIFLEEMGFKDDNTQIKR